MRMHLFRFRIIDLNITYIRYLVVADVSIYFQRKYI